MSPVHAFCNATVMHSAPKYACTLHAACTAETSSGVALACKYCVWADCYMTDLGVRRRAMSTEISCHLCRPISSRGNPVQHNCSFTFISPELVNWSDAHQQVRDRAGRWWQGVLRRAIQVVLKRSYENKAVFLVVCWGNWPGRALCSSPCKCSVQQILQGHKTQIDTELDAHRSKSTRSNSGLRNLVSGLINSLLPQRGV